jgi:hypothetical protein
MFSALGLSTDPVSNRLRHDVNIVAVPQRMIAANINNLKLLIIKYLFNDYINRLLKIIS